MSEFKELLSLSTDQSVGESVSWSVKMSESIIHYAFFFFFLKFKKLQREILFTMISKTIYKNYKILKKIEKYIKMSNNSLRYFENTIAHSRQLGLI